MIIKNVIILVGLPGSGKSTFAKSEASKKPGSVICSADHFFTNEDGKYNYDISLKGAAHKMCQVNFLNALNDPNCDLVIVDNTNTKWEDLKYYKNACEKHNLDEMTNYGQKQLWKWSILVINPDMSVEESHRRNVHSVPLNVIENMKNNLEKTMKHMTENNINWQTMYYEKL